jgi:predicted amidophosphoribosyltransferase
VSAATVRGNLCLRCCTTFTGAADQHIAACTETEPEVRLAAFTRIETRYEAAVEEAKARDDLRMCGYVGLNTDQQRRRWLDALAILSALDGDEQVAA